MLFRMGACPQHGRGGPRPRRPMPMDAYRRDRAVVAHFDLLGADPRTVAVSVDHDVLTVSADQPAHRSEATLWQCLELGDDIDREHVHVRCADGVVTVTLPFVGQQ